MAGTELGHFMTVPLRLLIVEDRASDAELMVDELRTAGFEPHWDRVLTEQEYLAHLNPDLDLILADYNLPQFDGLRALELRNERGFDIPFILVSGSLGEERAVIAMQSGAADYLVKDRLARLGPAVVRELEQKRLREQKTLAETEIRKTQKRFQALIEHAADAVALLAADGKLQYASPSTERVLGFTAEELLGRDLEEFLHPDDREMIIADLSDLFREPGKSVMLQYRAQHKDLGWRWIESTITNLLAEPNVNAVVFNYRDITERKQSEQEVRRRAEELSVLYEMASDLTKETDLTSLLQTVVHRAMTLLVSPGGSLMFYDKSKRDLEIVVSEGPELLKVGTHLELGEGIAGRVAETRQSMIVNDYAGWSDRLPALGERALTACIEVPMLYQGDLLGVLAVIESNPAHKFGESDLSLLALFASQAAGAVHNARLLAQTQERANQLAALYDAGLALNSVLEPRAQIEFLFKIAIRALHADRAEFFRYDAARNELCLELGIGHTPETLARLTELVLPGDNEGEIAGWVSKYRVPLSVPDVLADPRWSGPADDGAGAGIWVAIEHEDHLLGVLGVLSERVNAFTPMDERLMVLFANQAAVALQNARLFAETQQRLQELQLVNRISAALREAQTLDEMLPRMLEETMTVLDAINGSVWLADATNTELSIVAQQGWGDPPFKTVKVGESMLGHVFVTGVPYLSRDAKNDPLVTETQSLLIPEGASGVGIPIRIREQVVGVLGIGFRAPRQPSATDLSLLTTVAEMTGNAVHRTRLDGQTEQQVAHLGALRAIDLAISGSVDLRVVFSILLEQVMTQLHVDASCVLLLNQPLHLLEYAAGRGFRTQGIERSRLPLGGGLAGHAALEGITVAVPDLSIVPLELGRAQLIAGEAFVAYYAVPLITGGHVTGVLEIFHRAPLEPPVEWLEFMQALAGQAAIAIDNATLFQGIQRSNTNLSLAYDATIEGWSHALDLRDRETEGHSERVTETTLRLARGMHIEDEELVQMRRGALLHDIGKMGIPDNILLKPGPLTDEEWKIMRMHPVHAYELLGGIAYLHGALDIPYSHHEKWDGSGYPRGLKGDQIPLAARIFAVVDVWDALRSDRPYRKGWSDERVREYLAEQSGTDFDPKVVDAFLLMEQST